MTILQLKYVIAVSTSSSMREASAKLYISQPALSQAISDLEEELGIRIFDRTNKGITVTPEGTEFISFAKQAVSQYRLVEEKYLHNEADREYKTISMQHYVFAVQAFVKAVQRSHASKYSYFVNETKTDEVLINVRDFKSEVGVLSYSKNTQQLLFKLLREYDLEFTPLMVCQTYAYLTKKHPLAKRTEVSIEELKEYPCVTFDQTSDTEFYLSEEALAGYSFDRIIRSNDRATSCELMALLDGFAIGTGIMTESNALKDIFLSIKIREEDPLTIGYITKKNHILSDFGKIYVEELKRFENRLS